MTKQTITEEDKCHDKWYADARKQTLDTLPAFLKHLMSDYNHDYGTICHAISAGAVATACAMNSDEDQGGVTGYQASFIMWGFIQKWMRYEDQPLTLLQMKDMLYPQCESRFNTISKDTWAWLQKKAREELASNKEESVSCRVLAHWQRIIDGHIPFGLKLNDEDQEDVS